MNIEQSHATKIRLTELERLDPITVYLEDFEHGKGKITVECYGKSWSAYWGAMGDTIAGFFAKAPKEYIAGNFGVHVSTRPDFDALEVIMKKRAVELRREGYISKRSARGIYETSVDGWEQHAPEFTYAPWTNPDTLEIDDDDYELATDGIDVPEMECHKYAYVCRIIRAVQEALEEINSTNSGKVSNE